ncbi:MAG: GNAT family N-acetyltransferase [Lacrimispora sp.]|uniref:GNAT family N-acetyltransferase n=1 Tax=Lacrimispora sp. TaxID=2719234 RepID=UPI0039E3D890
MNIRNASLTDLGDIKNIVCQTIQTIYSRYYPKGAVEFFLSHHCEANIRSDIVSQTVSVLEIEDVPVGTVTIKEFEICRLFVLPQYQGNGYGRALLDFAEQIIADKHTKIRLDASLPAKEIYLKRGYKEIESHSILTENGDYLFYDIMEKSVSISNSQIDYNGKVFIPKVNSENGEADGDTIFQYHQSRNLLWAEYAGGEVVRGHLIGTVSDDGLLDFHYQHMNEKGQIRIGKCHTVPRVLKNGKLELHEEWQWLNGDKSMGSSILIER